MNYFCGLAYATGRKSKAPSGVSICPLVYFLFLCVYMYLAPHRHVIQLAPAQDGLNALRQKQAGDRQGARLHSVIQHPCQPSTDVDDLPH